jgi:hypothetical protein
MKPATLMAAAAALLLLSACSSTPSLEARTDYNREFDFSGVDTIAIQPVQRANLAAVRISDMQVARMNAAFRGALQARGLKVVEDNAQADLLMTWHLVTEERMDVRTYNTQSSYTCWRCGPAVSDVSVRQYTQGTLIVDMIDPERNRSVWRSIVQSRLRQTDAEQAEALRNEAARASFAKFPPA